jgi:hypothetical protein
VIEADLLRWYRLDLQRDLGTPRLTWRRLRVLLGQLPRESGLVQRTGGDVVRWGSQEHLLASVVDELRILDWHYVSSHSRGRVPAPPLIPRPGVKAAAELVMSVAEFAAQVSGGAMTI